ncbi:CLC4F protein, partial [Polypterus senegalus]
MSSCSPMSCSPVVHMSVTFCEFQYLSGHLHSVTFPSSSAFSALVEMEGREDKSYWIGLTDQNIEGDFVWVDEMPLDKQKTFWAKRDHDHGQEPDNWIEESISPGEDCVHLQKSKIYSGWYDAGCEMQKKRICEAPCSVHG